MSTKNMQKLELNDKVLDRFEKQLKKIWVGMNSQRKARPVLSELNYHDNGSIEITNSHVAIRLKDVHNLTDVKNENGNYPTGLSKIFDGLNNDCISFFTINKKDMRELEKQLNVMYRFLKSANNTIAIEFDQSGVTIVPVEDETLIRVKVDMDLNINNEEKITRYLNARYLHDALMMFRQLGLSEVEFKISENVFRPILLTSQNLEYIITPIRYNK